MTTFSQTAYNLGVDPSNRAALLDRLAVLAAGGAGELTPARAALLANLDAAVTSRAARPVPTSEAFGQAASSVAGAVLYDSGPLAAGEYELWCTIFHAPIATSISGQLQVQHRNAANAANVDAFATYDTTFTTNEAGVFGGIPLVRRRFTVALNERIRIVDITGDAGSSRTGWAVWLGLV